jgi:hypothetical protein
VYVVTVGTAALLLPALAPAQDAAPLAGTWTLNRSLSELPREIGFSVDWIPSSSSGGQGAGSSGGGRERRGSGNGGNRSAAGGFSVPHESSEDARRVQLLTAEARKPPVRLMVIDTPAAVTITNELGHSRAFHPNGKEESIELQGVPILVTTKRDGEHLVVVYHVEQDRDLRYTYSRSSSPSQFIVEAQFLEHGAGDKIRLVYEPGVETATFAPAAPPAPSASTRQQAPETLDKRPGAELRELTSLGILVEDLSAQAVACGLNHDTLETALSKRLTYGGFTVRKNSDDDTYLYVNVVTTTLSNGTCVTRYDAFLYTHATAKLTYRAQPVLVQVSLMHRWGIGGSSTPTAHAAMVVRGLENYVDLFVTQIHDANK